MHKRLTAAAIYLLSLLPFPVLYFFSDLLYIILYYLVSYRRQVVATNLANAFPEKSDADRKMIGKRFYRFLADQILESLKMRSLSIEELHKRFRLNNLPEMQRHFQNGKGVIAATGHYANWEWGTLIITSTIQEPVIVVYKPIGNKTFEDIVNQMRSRFGAILVAMKSTMRKLAEYRGQPFLMLLVSDQTPVAHEAKHFTTFLNQPTAVFLGIEKIASLTRNPVIFCHINRWKRGHYECTFKTLTEEPHLTAEFEVTELHTRELESVIRQKPELWLWSHKRWKFKPEPGHALS